MENNATHDYEQIRAGITFLWNNRFDEAEKIFGSQKDKTPRYALHYAEVAFLRSFITADTQDTQAANDRLVFVKDLSEKHLKAYEKGVYPNDETKKIANPAELVNKLIDTKIVLGDSLYMTAILQMTRDAKIKGAFNLRKSWKVFEGVLKQSQNTKDLDPELQKCIQFGAGFFLFAMSIIPQKFLKFVELAGFKADRDGGLYYIRDCHKGGGIRAPFATMLLLFNNLLLPRGLANAQSYLEEADALIKESLERYPKSSLFQVMGSHSARKQCNVEQGIKYMEMALDSCSNLTKQPLIYKYELANCFCMKLDWQKAVEQFTPLIKEEQFQVRILSAVQLGACYMMTGNQQKALETFTQLQSFGGKKSSIDNIVIRQAKRYVANGGHFAAFELLYLRRDLAKMIPNMARVLESLENVASRIKANEKKPLPEKPKQSPIQSNFSKFAKLGSKITSIGKKADVNYQWDDRAAYLLLKGSLIKSMGKNEEAIQCFREVIEMQEVLVEKLYLPYCCYELGESYYILGRLKEAEEMMKKCSKFGGYDWEDPLRVRLRVTMDQLKKGEKPSVTIPPSLDALASMVDETKIDDKEPTEESLEGKEEEQEFKEEVDE